MSKADSVIAAVTLSFTFRLVPLLCRDKHSEAEIVSICSPTCNLLFSAAASSDTLEQQIKKTVVVALIVVQSTGWGKGRGGEFREIWEWGRGGWQDMCYFRHGAFRPTVPSLFYHCRQWLHRSFLSHDDDYTDPVNSAASDRGLEGMDDLTKMFASLRKPVLSLLFVEVPGRSKANSSTFCKCTTQFLHIKERRLKFNGSSEMKVQTCSHTDRKLACCLNKSN